MENYIVSARKYRPSTFESVVGQKALTTTLKNAIATQKLAHAYLFCGPRGVGKTTCARIFAKTINCLSTTADGEPCNECESCRAFNEQRSYNIHELDAASNNSVEDIRSLIDQVRIPPQIGKYKVYIIDEVHMLSQQAFNAFLKTLEEPPHHAIFILATTEKHKILPTILSRCQIYDFNRISVNDTVEHLMYVAGKEGINAEPEALNVIAQKADGGMRDALSIFDQVVSFTGGNIQYKNVIENLNVLDYEYYFRLTDCLLANKTAEVMVIFDDILRKGFDGNHFVTGLSSHFRDLLVSRDAATLPLLEVGASIRERYQQQAQSCPPQFLYRAMKLCNDCDLNYRASRNKRLLVEITLIQLSQLTAEPDDPAHGRGPEQIIKPIFSTLQPAAQGAQPAVTNQAAATAVNGSVAPAAGQSAVPAPGEQGAAATRVNPIPKDSTQKKTPVLQVGQLGLSIKKPLKKEPEQAATATSTAREERPRNEVWEDYVVYEKDLVYYWKDFAGRLPQEERAAQGRMMSITLTMINDVIFEVLADNQNVFEQMSKLRPRIEEHLRVNLHNRKVSMQVRIREDEERVRAFGRVEQFQMMGQKNPALLKLRNELGLELD